MGRINEVVVIDLSQVERALGSYAITEIRDLRLCANGIINTNYVVQTEDSVYLLRIYNEDRDLEGILFEISILEYLSQAGFIVQRPIQNTAGEYLGLLEGREFVLLQYIEGEVLAQADINPTLCFQVGVRLAEMENLLDGFIPKGHKPDADYPLIKDLALKNLDRLSKLGAEGKRVAEELRSDWYEVEKLFRNPGLSKGVVHADIYYQNVIVRDGELVGFIDFDDSYWGVRFYDLALVLMEFSIKQEGSMEMELLEALLSGYQQKRQLLKEERSLLYDAMRFLCFKFLGYTAELDEFAGKLLLTNGYIHRLVYFRDPAVRVQFDAVLTSIDRER